MYFLPNRYINIQTQTGARDCGLFAIANALCIASGVDPSEKTFDQGTMRENLVKGIDSGVLEAFKARNVTRKWRYCNTVTESVYCLCRGLEEGDMIQCSQCNEWFHKECCNVDTKYFSNASIEWTCTSCPLT